MIIKNNIIAEVGSVHDGSFGNALKLIETASKCGATVVKFQTHLFKYESLKDAPSPKYFSSESRMDYFTRTGFSKKQWRDIKKCCCDNNVLFSSSSFSVEAFLMLEEIEVDIHKVPSGEVTNIPLLEKMSESKKKIILSSGMSNWRELDNAVDVLKNNNLVVMQCSSIYPCPPEKVGLNVLVDIGKRYSCPYGLSDHTTGFSAGIAAAILGACDIEKHFTFSKFMYGSDAFHSMEPKDFTIYCKSIKDAWIMMKNQVDKNNISSYEDVKKIFEKSIVINSSKKAGHVLARDDLSFKKCGKGISASLYKTIIGKTLSVDTNNNHILNMKDFK